MGSVPHEGRRAGALAPRADAQASAQRARQWQARPPRHASLKRQRQEANDQTGCASEAAPALLPARLP
eukprot:5446947-Pyramimonas_sp.AAC.1